MRQPGWRGSILQDVLQRSRPAKSVEVHAADVAVSVAKNHKAVGRRRIDSIFKNGRRGRRQISELRLEQRLMAGHAYAAVDKEPLVE